MFGLFRYKGLFDSATYGMFGLAALKNDPNCILIQDPSAIWGGADHLPRRNLLLATDTLATQNVTVTAEAHTLYLQGTGSVTLSGTGSGTLQGTGANDRVTLAFTPTAGTLTLTVSGTVTFGMLCKSSVTDRSYQKITDWTTEQYAWAATKNVPWLKRNAVSGYTDDFTNAVWATGNSAGGAPITKSSNSIADPYGITKTVSQFAVGANSTGYSVCYDGGTTPLTGISGVTYTFGLWIKRVSGGTKLTMMVAQAGTTPTTSNAIVELKTIADTWTYYQISGTLTADATPRKLLILFGLDGRIASHANQSAITVDVCYPSLQVGSTESYQRIATTWPAEYTSLAQAAGYPISLYSDRAGTTATYGPDDPVGKLLDLSGDNNHATAPSDAARPNLRLNGNGKWYLDRDTTDDALAITWPANFTTTAVQYVADQSVTTETTGITLNGATSYTTPQRPTGDYGRIIFKTPTPNAAKVLKYLAGKAGR